MGMLEDVATFLQAQGVATIGTNLFLGQRPDQPDNCLSLFQYAGPEPDMDLDSTLAFEKPRLQVLGRSIDDPLIARNLVQTAWTLLAPLSNVWLRDDQNKGTFYPIVNALQSPFQMGFDENRRALWGANFQMVRRPIPELF